MADGDNQDDAKLLAECDVDTFTSSGPGGQNVNRRETAVRLHHRPSGIVVTCQQERSQLRNKHIALQLIRERLAERNKRRIPRVKTRVPRAIRENILKAKHVRSERKYFRRRPRTSDE